METAAKNGLFSKFKIYHAKHPIIVSEIIFFVGLCAMIGYKEYHADQRTQWVAKYKRNYVVLRPDDPAVSMIKRERIGLDY